VLSNKFFIEEIARNLKKKAIVTVLDAFLDGTQFSGKEQCTWFVNI